MRDLIDREAAIAGMAAHLRSLITRGQAVDVLRALPAVTPAVKVKPLEWAEFGRECVRAESPFGLYDVMWGFGVELAYLTHLGKMWKHPTIEAAKAAAQADYEARILSALSIQPAPTLAEAQELPEIKALVEAAANIRDKHWNSTLGVSGRDINQLESALSAIAEGQA